MFRSWLMNEISRFAYVDRSVRPTFFRRSESSWSFVSVSRSFPFSRMTVTLSVIQSPISSASLCGFSGPSAFARRANSDSHFLRGVREAPSAAGSFTAVSRP